MPVCVLPKVLRSPFSLALPHQEKSQERLVLSKGDGRLRYPRAFSVEDITCYFSFVP